MDGYASLRTTVERVADDGVNGDTGAGDVAVDDILAALESLRALRDELADWEPRLIGAARRHGASWADLAPALGVASRQAAERRYLRLRKPEHGRAGAGSGDGVGGAGVGAGATTADGRVQAERDRRAGERAVRAWAQANSGAVRTLAAMVSAVEPADESTRLKVDVVYRRLGEDDPVALLEPLAAVAEPLHATRPELAEQVDELNAQVQQARREALERRVGR
ncbi:hypothetical protein BJF85_20225 [Saccharomonospora sp. CUA-673]|uniref:hypothetical protein n=1 Tax=Saccharomonospora sp. CUA-673 TaxID=1904969 RepID=UPI00095E1962|nr:hypothetical protein [Saccharomonospora sp. CUA-673]OLT44206.1 hypothetical protein BJF85_20225 [Saccharomonospora sp. CUA-673]